MVQNGKEEKRSIKTLVIVATGLLFCGIAIISLNNILSAFANPDGVIYKEGLLQEVKVESAKITVVLDSGSFTYIVQDKVQQFPQFIVGQNYKFELNTFHFAGVEWFSLKGYSQVSGDA